MRFSAFIALCIFLCVAGCEAVSSRVAQGFSPVPPHTRTFAAGTKAVYEAGLLAVKTVGLQLGHSSFAHGRIEGYAPIRTGDSIGDASQTTIDVRLTETGPGETRVDLLVWEQAEGKFPGGVSQQAFREHGLYETYFAALQQILVGNGTLQQDAKP